jgi:hypothetical protein
MPAIATINKTEPVVTPATVEKTYSHLDLVELRIRKNGGYYNLSAIFAPYDSDNDETLVKASTKWRVHDLGTFLQSHSDLKTKTKDFVKELAAVIQANPNPDPTPEP